MDKLKLCPFCGNKAKIGNNFEGQFFVWCTNDDCDARIFSRDRENAIRAWNRQAEETPSQQQWISVEDSLPPERETIFAKFYGTDKWRSAMFRMISDDVRVVKVFHNGTRRVHHDHTVDGVWESERKGSETYGRVTHWMANPRLPEAAPMIECVMCGETFTEDDLAELREIGEAYYREEGCFLCPDCWDSFRRMDPEEQVKMALVNGWKEVNRETDL